METNLTIYQISELANKFALLLGDLTQVDSISIYNELIEDIEYYRQMCRKERRKISKEEKFDIVAGQIVSSEDIKNMKHNSIFGKIK